MSFVRNWGLTHSTFVPHMARYLASICLIIAFAAQTFHQGIIVLSYYTNGIVYARTCENKARPTMHCNGKCQMMKKLQEEEKKGEQAPERKLVNNVEVLSSKSHFALLPSPAVRLLSILPGSEAHLLPQDYAACIFHPPA